MHPALVSSTQQQIYWSAPAPHWERGRRRAAFALVLVLGCERLLREGRLAGDVARLADGQLQAARLLAAQATGARWATRRGDALARSGDPLAAALCQREYNSPHEAKLLAANDLIGEVVEWLTEGSIRGFAAGAAIDRLAVARVLLSEWPYDYAPLSDDEEPLATEAVAPNAWQD